MWEECESQSVQLMCAHSFISAESKNFDICFSSWLGPYPVMNLSLLCSTSTFLYSIPIFISMFVLHQSPLITNVGIHTPRLWCSPPIYVGWPFYKFEIDLFLSLFKIPIHISCAFPALCPNIPLCPFFYIGFIRFSTTLRLLPCHSYCATHSTWFTYVSISI